MDSIHQTSSPFCRFLDESYFTELYHAFLLAFSDYMMPVDLTEVQFRNHIVLNAVDLSSSVGYFDGERIVGFSLNGFRDWHGIPTVYDAGTGVFPAHRRRGLSLEMFGMMMPIFQARGYRQCLLEVITSNRPAIDLYDSLGFRILRTVSLLHCPDDLKFRDSRPDGIEIRDAGQPDWARLRTFWDGEPAWQNSCDAIDSTRDKKGFYAAYDGDTIVGYIVFSKRVGRVAQIAVDRSHRRRGIGKLLTQAMIAEMSGNFVPQVINIDRSVDSAMTFFANRGFTEKLSQYEMLLTI